MAQLNNLIVTGDARVNGDLIHNSGMVAFGTCSTAAGTAAKEVVINDPAWSLKVGDIIGVKFTASNTASSCTINVNGSGAKQIWYNTSVYTSTSGNICGTANRYIYYLYDGTYWSWLNSGLESNDNNVPAAISWTAAGTAAKTATHNYYTAIKGYDLVTFQYANSAASALTLNINGKGAKPIYINGTASSESNYTLPAGCYLTYYDGTNYYIRTDGLITGSITGNAATATRLSSAKNINGVAFDGNSNITITANPTPNQLNEIDLNTITTPGFYYGGGGNNCTNKPSGADAFGMIVYKTANGYVAQEFTNGNNNPLTKYIRYYNSSVWSVWKSASASSDGIVSSNDTVDNIITLTKAEYNALTTKEKNTLYNITDDVSADGENASQTSSGYMSAEDKIKLDGITASADSVSFTSSLTSGTKVGTITINGANTDLYAPAQATAGAITTQVKSYTSGEFSVYDTNSGTGSFTATGPGSGWYPTCVTVPHGSGTTTLGSGIYSHGITMTSAGNNTCSGTIYVTGNSGNASTNRGKCTYYVTWAKIG